MPTPEERRRDWLAYAGLAAFVVLTVCAMWRVGVSSREKVESRVQGEERRSSVRRIRMLAVGDINLGRRVGQEILRGDTLFPFVHVADTLRSYDVVFANLESNISDQHGRTEHPRSNIVFTAPPAAAQSLRRAGITVVSTANNHALDFGVHARNQTLRYLDSVGVAHSGTASSGEGLYRPAVISVHGIRVAFFAVTDIMNMTDPQWKQFVASADTAALLAGIRGVRDSVDLIVVSFHGGEEYADRPTSRTREFARETLSGGADLFLGHHPHIPYGIDRFGRKYAFPSLGNFVFLQPDRYWTRYSYAVSFDVVRDSAGTSIQSLRTIPLRVGFQPEFLPPGEDADRIMERIRALSSHDVAELKPWLE